MSSRRTQFAMLGDVYVALENDRQTRTHHTDLGQGLAGAIGADLAKAANPFNFGRFQNGEHLVASRFDDRWCRHRHHGSHFSKASMQLKVCPGGSSHGICTTEKNKVNADILNFLKSQATRPAVGSALSVPPLRRPP